MGIRAKFDIIEMCLLKLELLDAINIFYFFLNISHQVLFLKFTIYERLLTEMNKNTEK